MKEKLPRILFVFSLLFFSYGYGLLTMKARVPPYSLLDAAYEVWKEREHWRNDLGLLPTRHLVEAKPGRDATQLVDPERLTPGLRIVAGLTAGRDTLHGARLIDDQGAEVHFWPIDYSTMDERGPGPENVYLHGMAVFEDGSLIVNFDGGRVLTKISACGQIVWLIEGEYHHTISKSQDGTIWSLETAPGSWDQLLTQIDPITGEILRRVSLLNDIVRGNDAQGLFELRTDAEHEGSGARYLADPFHINDVEILPPAFARSFPLFEAGDIMISLRNINLVAVIDGRSSAVKWWRHGPWHRQHDPDFLSDGTISVLDNNMGYAASEILRIDPVSNLVSVSAGNDPNAQFYTRIRGKHQVLENGHILITVSQEGRALEVDENGQKVWEFNNIYDDQRNGVISKVVHVPPAFFDEGALDCRG